MHGHLRVYEVMSFGIFKVWANASEANQPSLRRRLRISPGISDALRGFAWVVGFESLRVWIHASVL